VSEPEIRLGRYRHYKGTEYEVLGIAQQTETMQVLVIYRATSGDTRLWARPWAMFVEDIDVDGDLVPRFAWVGDIG
jgi:hypothetical protein